MIAQTCPVIMGADGKAGLIDLSAIMAKHIIQMIGFIPVAMQKERRIRFGTLHVVAKPVVKT